MKFYQEVTEWQGNTQNHIYYLTDDKRKMVGYIKQNTKDLFKFSKPMSFDGRGRKLILLKMEAESDEVYFPKTVEKKSLVETIEVEGSNGKKYTLSKVGKRWTCSCPGFQFRNKCKHSEGVK